MPVPRGAALAILALAGTTAVAVLLLAGVGLSYLVHGGIDSAGYTFVYHGTPGPIIRRDPTTLWFNPRYGDPYIGPGAQWQIGEHSYRTRDLMGRGI